MEGIMDSQELLVRYVSRAWREGEGEADLLLTRMGPLRVLLFVGGSC